MWKCPSPTWFDKIQPNQDCNRQIYQTTLSFVEAVLTVTETTFFTSRNLCTSTSNSVSLKCISVYFDLPYAYDIQYKRLGGRSLLRAAEVGSSFALKSPLGLIWQFYKSEADLFVSLCAWICTCFYTTLMNKPMCCMTLISFLTCWNFF